MYAPTLKHRHPSRHVLSKMLLAASLCLLFAPLTSARDLPTAVLTALKTAQIPLQDVAVVVQSSEATTPLISHNATAAFNPASVMKLVTTYAALDLLGPAYTWNTDALADAPVESGKPIGNLYLKGSGDPKFAIEHLWSLLRQLRVRGVQQINGDVVLDRTAFNVPSIDPGAFDDKPMRPYNVGPDALLVNFRALRFTLSPGTRGVQMLAETPSEGLRVDNRITLSTGECSSDWKDLIAIRLIPEAAGSRLEFTGSFSGRCPEKTLNIAPLPADAQVSGLFRALWKELGGTLNGQVREGVTPSTALVLARHESPALADSVRDINKWSNNVMARQVFLTLGNTDGPATAERARQRINNWLESRGLVFRELELENGSGLSRRERISAGSLNRLLLDAWKSPVMPELVSSLPVVGIDGTMRKRLKDSEITGRAHIKTGTLDNVKTAAGYALDPQGKVYTVVFLINSPRSRAGQPAIDALLLWIAQGGR